MLKLQTSAAGNNGSTATNSGRERVRLCGACDRAPAAFLCETDVAALCSTCDSDIHTANPLARLHRRIPIPPPAENAEEGFLSGEEGDEASWLLLDSVGNDHVVEEYLNLDDYYNSCQNNQKSCGGDSVVPIQNHFSQFNNQVSPSPAEVAVVPESRISEVSIRTPKGTVDSIQMGPTPLTPLEREARVLRYREKKKTRKFVKTIRYASRKTYAETRPRIKGRFAKRKTTDVEHDLLCIFN